MAQKMLRPQTMPELQLRQELRSRFPKVNGSTVMKVMKLYNNDTEKCIQALEHESQKPSAAPTDANSYPHSSAHNNDVSHGPGESINRTNNNQQPWTVGSSNIVSAASAGAVMSRYQEVPVKHETTHISTVKHTVTPPVVPPKPLPPRPDPTPFAHPTMPPVQARAPLVIDPANRGDPRPGLGYVKPPDFSSYIDSSPRRQTDIPNIRCAPSSSEGGGASGGSPESRRPVRVINVQGAGHTGGTVMSGQIVSPTSVQPSHRFRVVLGDGGGMCSMPVSSVPVTSSSINPYRFSSQALVPSQTRAQELERPGLHSSSIYIDPATNIRRTSIQESGGDPPLGGHPQQFRPGAQYLDSQVPSSQPVPRTMQPLTVSLSSHAIYQGLPEQGQNVVSFAGKGYPGGFATGLSHALPCVNNDSSGFVMNMGNRFAQEGASASPPHGMMNQLSLSSGSGAVGPPQAPTSSSPNVMGPGMSPMYGMSPVLMPKSPILQHQRSTGSSTSRSNSMDSEHGSSHHPTEAVMDHAFQPHGTPPLPSQRGIGVVEIGLPGFSAASTSNHSSLSSESSVRDLNALPRQRSGSIQEEAAYTQALLVHQKQRMDKLTEDIEDKRQLLIQLRHEVSHAEKSKILENSLRTSFPTADDISRLCESNRRLQTDIQMYLNEIDMYKNGQTPFSIIDPMGQQNFFNNMPTGPNDLFIRPPPIQRSRSPPPPPPPRPPPPRLPPQPVQRVNSNDLSTTVPPPNPGQTQGGGSGDSEEGEKWACSACTFENHPALKKCEICEMPRMMKGS